jgi:hypothetical protein
MTASLAVQLSTWRHVSVDVFHSTASQSVSLLVCLRCGHLGYGTALVWLVGGKGNVFIRSVVAHLQDCNTVSRRRRRGFVSLRPWKPLVMRLSLYWSIMACRRGGEDVLIHNLRGWSPQVPAALHWEWDVINRRVRSVGVGAALNIVAKQRIASWAGSRIPRCLWHLTDSTVLAYYCTTNYVLLLGCCWARVCDF